MSMNRENYPIWYDGKYVNEPLFCAEYLYEHPLRCIGGRLFDYNGPVESEDSIRREIAEKLGVCVTGGISRRTASLFDYLKLHTFTPPELPQYDRIHFKNGIYYVGGDFEDTIEFCANRIPHNYNPNAERPRTWLSFLKDLLEDDDILTLQEYLGYCLIPCTKAQKMLLIIGRGGEGKSRIGLVMSALLGKAMNTGSIQKVETNSFARADLLNRLLLVDDDMDMNALPKTNYIKSIVTSEGAMDLERKREQSFQGQLYARLMCFSNGSLNSLYDFSDGFYRRQIILQTKPRPADRTDNPYLIEMLTSELEGILVWCLEGLNRLVMNDFVFTIGDTAKKNMSQLRRNNDNILEFLESEGYISFKPNAEASSKLIYEAYMLWCSDNAYKPYCANRFSQELQQHASRLGIVYSNNIRLPGGKRVRGYTGIEARRFAL